MTKAIICLLLACFSFASTARGYQVAVASNFKDTLQALGNAYDARTGNKMLLSAASTGKHYAQITNGAPFELFFAADSDRPAKLEAEGYVVADTRFTYALGGIVFWAPGTDGDCLAKLKANAFATIAMANPKTAPYGLAAEQTLARLEISDVTREHIVTGENISQTMQFVDTGAAQAGFVAKSHWITNDRREQGCHWFVPGDHFEPIAQQAVLLKKGAGNDAAKGFLDFVRTPEAADIIRNSGYDIAE